MERLPCRSFFGSDTFRIPSSEHRAWTLDEVFALLFCGRSLRTEIMLVQPFNICVVCGPLWVHKVNTAFLTVLKCCLLFFTGLICTLMVQKQQWVKTAGASIQCRQWHQTCWCRHLCTLSVKKTLKSQLNCECPR